MEDVEVEDCARRGMEGVGRHVDGGDGMGWDEGEFGLVRVEWRFEYSYGGNVLCPYFVNKQCQLDKEVASVERCKYGIY